MSSKQQEHTFVDRFGLWSDDQHAQARELVRRIDSGEVDLVRFAWPDQHGILRGKTLVATEARSALWEGVNLTSTLLAKDTSHKTVFPVFSANGGFAIEGLQGGADFTIVADPATFKVLPWAPRTGWVLCDAYMADGKPCPFATRQILQRAVRQLDELGLDFIAGLEVEFHVFKLEDARMGLADSGQPGEPPRVSLLSHGHQYLTELRYDRVDTLMELLRSQLIALGLPLRSLEIEFGPSQFELTFGPTAGVMPADTMVLLRSAIKQICQRAGLHATFMCRPKIPNVMSSGWHLHQSLRRKSDGVNAFMPEAEGQAPERDRHALPGRPEGARLRRRGAREPDHQRLPPLPPLLARARPRDLGPDNRGAMLRVLGGGSLRLGAARIFRDVLTRHFGAFTPDQTGHLGTFIEYRFAE
jgi:glutamine synthetase